VSLATCEEGLHLLSVPWRAPTENRTRHSPRRDRSVTGRPWDIRRWRVV